MKNLLHTYSKLIRSTDEKVLDLFKDAVVVAENGTAHHVPIIWGSKERALTAVFQPGVGKDNGLVVDRIRLPLMSLFSDNIFPVKTTDEGDEIPADVPVQIGIRYKLTIHTLYQEDRNQLIEQFLSTMSRPVYLDQSDGWQTKVILNNFLVNEDKEVDQMRSAPVKVLDTTGVIYAYTHDRVKNV